MTINRLLGHLPSQIESEIIVDETTSSWIIESVHGDASDNSFKWKRVCGVQ